MVYTLTGVKCFVPDDWAYRNVKVMFMFADHCDYMYTRTRETSEGTFAPIPSMYVGHQATIQLY